MLACLLSCVNLVSWWSMQSFFSWAVGIQLTNVYLLERALWGGFGGFFAPAEL